MKVVKAVNFLRYHKVLWKVMFKLIYILNFFLKTAESKG